MVKFGTVIQYSCGATTDPLENVKISWLKDGKPVDFTSPHITRTYDNALLINGTTAADTGVYTCVASNGLDSATKDSKLEVFG